MYINYLQIKVSVNVIFFIFCFSPPKKRKPQGQWDKPDVPLLQTVGDYHQQSHTNTHADTNTDKHTIECRLPSRLCRIWWDMIGWARWRLWAWDYNPKISVCMCACVHVCSCSSFSIICSLIIEITTCTLLSIYWQSSHSTGCSSQKKLLWPLCECVWAHQNIIAVHWW